MPGAHCLQNLNFCTCPQSWSNEWFYDILHHKAYVFNFTTRNIVRLKEALIYSIPNSIVKALTHRLHDQSKKWRFFLKIVNVWEKTTPFLLAPGGIPLKKCWMILSSKWEHLQNIRFMQRGSGTCNPWITSYRISNHKQISQTLLFYDFN